MKTDNNKVQIRKRALEYCILLQLENKPLYVDDILEMVRKSKMVVEEGAHSSQFKPIGNYDCAGYKSGDFINQSPGNKVHLLWLWTGFLNVSQ